MAIIKQKNKKSGITYVYESFSYRDKTTRQPRSKRRLIGRLDEVTGQVVPTRRQNRKSTAGSDSPQDPPQKAALADELERIVSALRR